MPIFLAKYSCYGKSVSKHELPLVFDIHENPGEDAPMSDPSRTKSIIKLADDLVKKHKDSLIIAPSQVDIKDGEHLKPCCNPPTCKCNKEQNDEKICDEASCKET